jgi:hypothetical protein
MTTTDAGSTARPVDFRVTWPPIEMRRKGSKVRSAEDLADECNQRPGGVLAMVDAWEDVVRAGRGAVREAGARHGVRGGGRPMARG